MSLYGHDAERDAVERFFVLDDDGALEEEPPPDCPGMGIDDLCTWPDVEGCGLCTLGLPPELLR